MAEPNDGGLLAQLAVTVANLSETIAKQGERISDLEAAIRVMAVRLDELSDEPVAELPPKAYLSGKPM